MKEDIDTLKTAVERLRADLIATNLTLNCVFAAMPKSQQDLAMMKLAQLAVKQEDFAERSQNAAAIAPIQAALERSYQGLQAMQKLARAEG